MRRVTISNAEYFFSALIHQSFQKFFKYLAVEFLCYYKLQM